MKPLRVQLNRLFEAARGVPESTPESMPAHLKSRILARWHSTIAAEDSWVWLGLVFRRALVCAALVMALCLLWSSGELMSRPDNELAIVNYELRADLMP